LLPENFQDERSCIKMSHTFHKILAIIFTLILGIYFTWLMMSLVVSGLRIMLFGMQLVILPIVMIAFLYMFWHVRKFWK
jgi:hypothetical protein